MPDLDLQSEQFQELLAEALRAGPGSPQWHQAVRALRASNQNVDEYTLLHQAREDLESGKSYRSVQAGPGFTRKVMDEIDKQGMPSRGLPTATLIALIAGLVVVVVAAVVVHYIVTSNPDKRELGALDVMVFGDRFISTTFTAGNIPAPWLKIGELPLVVAAGQLKPGAYPATASQAATSKTGTATSESKFKIGGIVTSTAVAATTPVEVNATVKVNRVADEGVLQLFISDSPVDEAHPASAHELVWLFQGGQGKLFLPNGHAEVVGDKINSPREVPVHVRMNSSLIAIDIAGKRLYAGPHQLSETQPRYIGVRFLREPGEKVDGVGLTAISIAK